MKKIILSLILGISVVFASEFEMVEEALSKGDYEKASKYFKLACDDGFVMGCAGLGFSYKAGKGVSQDYNEAFKYFKLACDGKNAIGCAGLGSLYLGGQGVKQDYLTAKEYYKKACDLGDQISCNKYTDLNKAGH